MKFNEGLPPKVQLQQYIIKMKNHPVAVGMYNNHEKCFIIADPQCVAHNGEPYDCHYDIEWIDDKDIIGYWSLPE